MVHTLTNPFILVDGFSYLYRAYYAFPLLTNSIGESTGAIYGMINMLYNLLEKYHPSHAVVVFDAKGKTFRDELFKHYKSNRQPMPDTLRSQIEPLYTIIQTIGLPLITIPGVEADDVIGTLARKAEEMNHSVLISTNDKDMAQLVTFKTSLINNTVSNIFGPKEIITKYGVPPKLIIDFLALTGDTSDNIPGVPGIGKKTALALLSSFAGLDILYTELEKIADLMFRGAKTIATKLKENKKIAYLSYKLATIKTDVKIDFIYDQFKIQQPAMKELLKIFEKYEFKHWISNIRSGRLVYTKKQNIL